MILNALPLNPDQLLTRRQLTTILPVSYQTLARWSSTGDGPAWLKVGRRVAYRAGDVREWLDCRRKGGLTT
jgi:predicted DNA-binding transcriptional regulator AlpA